MADVCACLGDLVEKICAPKALEAPATAAAAADADASAAAAEKVLPSAPAALVPPVEEKFEVGRPQKL